MLSYFLDTLANYESVYALASIVFVGGSIAQTGGHNVLEPAAVGVPVIVGPHTYNFQSIVETFEGLELLFNYHRCRIQQQWLNWPMSFQSCLLTRPGVENLPRGPSNW